MKIKRLHIRNFKSLIDFKLENLPTFAAVIGPNASGKRNIFDALEFTNFVCRLPFEATSVFGGFKNIYSYQASKQSSLSFDYTFDDNIKISFDLRSISQREIDNIDDAYRINFSPLFSSCALKIQRTGFIHRQ